MRCSAEVRCSCPPDAPAVGTPGYAEGRAHPDAGDIEALELITNWVRVRVPVFHIRFADGEFCSMTGRLGVNGDGQPYDATTLGDELRLILFDMARRKMTPPHALIGGDWSHPEHAYFLRANKLFDKIPWCPSGIWVNGVVSGALARFFEALLADPRPRILVSNQGVSLASRFLQAKHVPVLSSASWSSRESVMKVLLDAPRDAVVIYCAGMSSKAFAWEAHKARKDLSHLDMGHVFDGAFGIRKRSWLSPEGVCVKRDTYFEKYAPVFRGEKSDFGF